MKAKQPKTIRLKEYTVPDFLIEKVDLEFDLFDEMAIVRSTLIINRNQMAGQHQRPLVLQGESLNLKQVKLNGDILDSKDFQVDEKTLTLALKENNVQLEIETEILPQKNTTLSGLYRSGQLFCTQCEAEGFRRMTYYLDRPDVMAPFTTTIIANKKKYPILLSNGNMIDKGTNGDRHWVQWQDPFKKPAYLFALVAGDLAEIQDSFTTASGRVVKLAIFVEPQNKDKCQHAMASLKHAMQWDEEQYGREYDLDIYMIVAVNDFNMGAMENKGLNIFNSKYILADSKTATDADFMGVEMVIGHEYFHNWTGNRVTLRDWFQLSLKEGLTVFREQQFSQKMGSAHVKRIEDVKQIRTRQFAEDSGPIAHPVRPDAYMEINNFYTMTIYYKGAEVIRMMHTLLGENKFRKGMDLYFERHDGQAVTVEHFIHALSDANPEESSIDFNQFMLWYTQAGTPVVTVTQNYDALEKKSIFHFKQTCSSEHTKSALKPFLIPIKINLYQKNTANKLPLVAHAQIKHTPEGDYFILSEAEDSLILEGVTEKLIPSLLGQFSAPVKLNYTYEPSELAFIIKHDDDSFNRWDMSQTLACEEIKKLLKMPHAEQDVKLPTILKEVYQRLLVDDETDPGLLTQLLALPSFYYIAETLDQVDVESLNHILTQLKADIATTFQDLIVSLYSKCMQKDRGTFNPEEIGYRSLKNTCLALLGRAKNEKHIPLIENQYHKAKNMTDRMGALWAISHWEHPTRQILFDDFYQNWKNDSLVVDKWFALQAQSETPDALEKIQNLMQHPAFDIKNPNKVYAVLRSLGGNNPICFHEKSGKSYQFLADQVILLNRQNPQVAARILEPLTQWRRLDSKHSALMKSALKRIKQQDDLSEDVYEIVSKSLVETS